MIRAHLEEDVQLIQRYFPGAKVVALRTPFDLSSPVNPWKHLKDNEKTAQAQQWGAVQWSH